MAKYELIEPYKDREGFKDGSWIITDKGREFLDDVDTMEKKWPILTEEYTVSRNSRSSKRKQKEEEDSY